MEWLTRFFEYKGTKWLQLVREVAVSLPGHRAYGRRQHAMWMQLATHADNTFVRVYPEYKLVLHNLNIA